VIKYRFCYAKFGDAKYISHLDLIRMFSRAFKRAGIPLTHSEGFNPHPKMAIGLPLSVGLTSECEYMDAELDRAISADDVSALNASLPMGISISAAAERLVGTKKLADIRWATYKVTLHDGAVSQDALDAFMARADVVVEKKTKRKVSDTDILPDIAALIVSKDGTVLTMTVSAGASYNIKPELVLLAMRTYIEGFGATNYDIHRAAIITDDGRNLM